MHICVFCIPLGIRLLNRGLMFSAWKTQRRATTSGRSRASRWENSWGRLRKPKINNIPMVMIVVVVLELSAEWSGGYIRVGGSNCPKSAGNLSGWIESAYGRTRRLVRWFGLDLSWEVFRSILRYLVPSHSIRFQTLGSCIANFNRQIDSFATAIWNSCSTLKTQQFGPCMSHCTEKGWAFYTWRYLFLISTSRLTSPEFTWFFTWVPPPIKITRQNITTEL